MPPRQTKAEGGLPVPIRSRQKAGGGKRDRLGEFAASKTGVECLDGDDPIRFERQGQNSHVRDHGIRGLGQQVRALTEKRHAGPWTFGYPSQWQTGSLDVQAPEQRQKPDASDGMPPLPSAGDADGVHGYGGQKQDRQGRGEGSSPDASRSIMGAVPATARREFRVVVMRRFGLVTRNAGA